MTDRTKEHTKEELLHKIMDAAAYIIEHPQMIRWAAHYCLERARRGVKPWRTF
jgi:hypothetical protein